MFQVPNYQNQHAVVIKRHVDALYLTDGNMNTEIERTVSQWCDLFSIVAVKAMTGEIDER